MSVSLILQDDIDISRGDMIIRPNNIPKILKEIELMVCWLNKTPLIEKEKYIIKHTSKEVKCIVKEIKYKIDINSLHRDLSNKNLKCNEIGRITIKVNSTLFVDDYVKNRKTGSLIIIDTKTNNTVGAGLII